MAKFTEEMVYDYANKLLIGLSSEENKRVLDEFEEIDRQIDLINKIPNIEDVEPMTHTLDEFEFELRDDEALESENIEDILANSDEHTEREIEVPKVVG